ncbi:MAG: hypothetical protein GC180_12150 [Bacteroidetes bacterium]|nr:hypothetical protein [Bacteroidota bacterium]
MKSLRILWFFLALLLFESSTQATDKTWIGGTSGWNTSSNWSPGGVPNLNNDSIIIGSGNPSFNGNMTLGSNASITINTGGTLDVSGKITINGTGQLILNGGTLNHTGSQFSFPYSSIANVVIYDGVFNTDANGFKVNSRMEMYGGELNCNSGLAVQSGKTFQAYAGVVHVTGHLDIQSSNSTFHAGKDSLVVNGNMTLGSSCNFYGDSAIVIINGVGNGNVTNNINGTFYTNYASVQFNTSATTAIGSGGVFHGNSGNVEFNDVATIGNSGALYVDSGTIVFKQDLTVSQSGDINAGSGSLTFSGNASFQNSGTLTAGSASITFQGSASFTQNGVLNADSSTLTFEGTASFSNSGTLNAGSSSVNFGGDVSISNNGGTINCDSANITITGDLNNSGNFNSGTSTVTLNGDSTQTITSDISFYNLNIQTQGTLTANGNVTVTGNGTIGTNSGISLPNNTDQFEVNGDLTDSSGTLAVSTNKPFVTNIIVVDSVTLYVIFDEQVTQASAENSSNTSWTGHTISSLTLTDTNKLKLVFSPAIVHNVTYTLVFQSIQNVKNPVGTMNAGHTKNFSWASPSAPNINASNLNFSSVTTNSMQLNWSNGSGQYRIVVARQNDTVNYIPVNGTSYTANSSFGNGTALNSSNYVVYSGSDSIVALTGLNAGQTYYFAVYEFNGSGSLSAFLTSNPLKGSQTSAVAAPTMQASGIQVNGSSDTSISISWTRGDGDSCLVVMRKNAPVISSPSNFTYYSANANFGDGETIGPSTFVVYRGTGTSVSITNLESNRNYSVAIFEFNGGGLASSYLSSNPPSFSTNTYLRLDLTLFLEGPFDGQHMSPLLNSYLPDTQVYNQAPWNYTGTEAVNAIPNDSVVDWVLVELRQAISPVNAHDTSVVGRRAGFLLSNGKVVDLDGVSPLLIKTSQSGRMYVVVYHRTHIPIQSSDSLVRQGNTFSYSFNGNARAYGNAPMFESNNGDYGMFCGKASPNSSGGIGNSDATAAWNNRNKIGYFDSDVNLDGIVNAEDRSIIWNNRGVVSEVVH